MFKMILAALFVMGSVAVADMHGKKEETKAAAEGAAAAEAPAAPAADAAAAHSKADKKAKPGKAVAKKGYKAEEKKEEGAH